MGMTMAEKILAAHSGKDQVRPGEYIWAKIDATSVANVMSEVSPIEWFEKLGIGAVFDPERVYVRNDQLICNISSAEEMAGLRRFVKKHGIKHWYEYGRHGILHQLFAEKGCALPGDLIAMADSHTTTYGAFNAAACGVQVESTYVLAKGQLWFRVPETIKFELAGTLRDMCFGKDVILKIAADYGTDVALYKSAEFLGEGARAMSLASRWTIANMGVEVGAKFTIFEADNKTFEFLKGRTDRTYLPVSPDRDAGYEREYRIDLAKLEPMVACPHEPSNSRPVGEVAGIPINQGFIGSCTNGRQEDLEVAAKILEGRKVHPGVRLLISPASMEVWQDALHAGWLETFAEAEAFVAPPSCALCAGQGMTILAAGERCISTTNRNFQGRMGSPESELYLASAATVAASAVAGEIADPRRI